MMEAPRKYIDTSIPGVPGSNQLVEPLNPEYIKWFIEKELEVNPDLSRREMMDLLMKDFRGKVNPNQILRIVFDAIPHKLGEGFIP